MIVRYTLAAQLEMALATVHEVQAECGLTPDFVEMGDGTRVVYDRADFRRLSRGELTPSEYIVRHRILTEIFFG